MKSFVTFLLLIISSISYANISTCQIVADLNFTYAASCNEQIGHYIDEEAEKVCAYVASLNFTYASECLAKSGTIVSDNQGNGDLSNEDLSILRLKLIDALRAVDRDNKERAKAILEGLILDLEN